MAQDGLRRDAVLLVVCALDCAAAIGLIHCPAHRVGDPVRVKDSPALEVTRCPAHGLDQRTGRAQKSLLVGVENRHQRYLGQIEPFAQ